MTQMCRLPVTRSPRRGKDGPAALSLVETASPLPVVSADLWSPTPSRAPPFAILRASLAGVRSLVELLDLLFDALQRLELLRERTARALLGLEGGTRGRELAVERAVAVAFSRQQLGK